MFCIKWTAFVSWISAHPLRSSISIQYLIYLTQHQYHKILIMSAPQIYLLHKRCTSTHASVLEMCHLVCQTLRFCFPGFFLLSLCFQSSLVVSKEEQDVTLIDGLIGDAHMQLHPYTIIHMVYFACIFLAYQILYSGDVLVDRIFGSAQSHC